MLWFVPRKLTIIEARDCIIMIPDAVSESRYRKSAATSTIFTTDR